MFGRVGRVIATTTMRILCFPLMILFKSCLSVISWLKSMNPWQHTVPIHKVKLCSHVNINLKNRIIVVVRILGIIGYAAKKG